MIHGTGSGLEFVLEFGGIEMVDIEHEQLMPELRECTLFIFVKLNCDCFFRSAMSVLNHMPLHIHFHLNPD